MARFSLLVAALSLVCLIAVVTSDDVPQMTTSENVCPQFFNEGSTMTISRVFDMVAIKFRDYVPDLGTELMRDFMKYADSDRDDRLNLPECQHLIDFIKHRTPVQQRK
ncbi:hypothetical protein AMELA_G00083330 [Ameiurus melas]|uniref:EF-hand domain-containing protein n=1 Tax=Ameiurus melas TaxID=219545 RepID=A0A7J6B0J0_AMEME|nr:hypothetical protein AMELA_G00083330 [Ameiurus melas]